MYNTFTVPKCLQSCKVWCIQNKTAKIYNRIFRRIDQFWKDLVCRTFHDFYTKKLAPTLDMFLVELKG